MGSSNASRNCRGGTVSGARHAKRAFDEGEDDLFALSLDDVMSELDVSRQDYILNHIEGWQVFITCCEDDRLPVLLGGKVFHVKQGTISG